MILFYDLYACTNLCVLFIFRDKLPIPITINLEIRSADQGISRNDDFIIHLINLIKNSA